MKKLRRFTILLLLTGLLFGTSSCLVLTTERKVHDNGHHWGWFKKPNKPHHDYHKNNDNPEKSKDHRNKNKEKSNEKSKGNKHRA